MDPTPRDGGGWPKGGRITVYLQTRYTAHYGQETATLQDWGSKSRMVGEKSEPYLRPLRASQSCG